MLFGRQFGPAIASDVEKSPAKKIIAAKALQMFAVFIRSPLIASVELSLILKFSARLIGRRFPFKFS